MWIESGAVLRPKAIRYVIEEPRNWPMSRARVWASLVVGTVTHRIPWSCRYAGVHRDGRIAPATCGYV